jgi:hypothetical protein
MKVRLGGEWRDILGAKARQASSWRTILAVKIYSGGAWRNAGTFSPTGTAGGMTLEIRDETSISGPAGLLTLTMVAVPDNGNSPFTYLWEEVSSSGPGSISIATPTKAKTVVLATFSGAGTIECTLRCTATDSVGSTATEEVTLTFIGT